ncbi:VirB4 family type IV secretion system protein [Paenibacillus chitinolyticus]|uniref:VirB4 family type IV secretion system protein n=1 Tax=Paenibacillus chitinolyticus TaxID=79263 RepID=UPI001C462950|nr:DUF87 domain-containing protein [Paenibacillus chitinolyticus]MBV6717204.1 DUF87 domain-containing protein [Paenibacillus chitinolyticus]
MAEPLKKKNISGGPALSGLLDYISPSGLDIKPKNIMLGSANSRVLVINAYPTEVKAGWLSKITKMPGVTVTVHAVPTDPFHLLNEIKIAMGEAEAKMETGNAVTRKRAKKQYDDCEILIKKIDEEQQKVYNAVVVILVTASDPDVLDIRVRNVEQRLSGMGMKGRAPIHRQEEGLISVGPWGKLDPDIFKFGYRNMPAESVAAMYPFVYSGINDMDGVLLGRDTTGGIVLIDIWKRGGDRTNSNLTILGRPGVGKSTTIKKWLKEEFGRGCRIIVIDPEDEYSGLAEGCGGTIIDAGNGAKSRINPLQVRLRVPLDDNSEEEKDRLYTKEEITRGPLALHFNFLRTFFKLYLKEGKDDAGFSKKHMACLEIALEDAYASKGITWDTDLTRIKVDQWPIMSDLLTAVRRRGEGEKYKAYWEDLELLLRAAAEGADQDLWNGPTTLKADDEIVVLNIQQLLEAEDTVRRAQFFNILSWAWSEIDADWEEQIILAVDEAYLLADPETPQALMFMRNASKRIRKREGGLWVITHNMIDFMDSSIKRFGQALLDNPAYKFIMGQGENDIEALTQLLQLSDVEIETISQAKRGQGLLIAGNKRLAINIKVNKEDEIFIGSAGGR